MVSQLVQPILGRRQSRVNLRSLSIYTQPLWDLYWSFCIIELSRKKLGSLSIFYHNSNLNHKHIHFYKVRKLVLNKQLSEFILRNGLEWSNPVYHSTIIRWKFLSKANHRNSFYRHAGHPLGKYPLPLEWTFRIPLTWITKDTT